MINKADANRENLHVMMKMTRMNYQEVLKRKNKMLPLNNLMVKDNNEMDHLIKEEKNINKTDKDMEVMIKNLRIEDKETMKGILKMILPFKNLGLKNRLQALDLSHDKISSII